MNKAPLQLFWLAQRAIVFAALYLAVGAACAHADEKIDALSERYRPDFEALAAWLETAPPPGERQEEREAELKRIDAPLMEEEAPKFDSVGDFFQARMDAFREGFSACKPAEGEAVIWKLYNHAEIIQTKSGAVAVDLIKGFDGVEWDEAALEQVVGRLDALLISHEHGDHADARVAKLFLRAGKPVVAPKDIWPDQDLGGKLAVIRKGNLEFPGIGVRVFPSMQKTVLNNVYLFRTEGGQTIMHLGDNNNFFQLGHEWFRKFKEPLKIDVLVPNIWSPDLSSLLKYVKPGLIVPSHEHEIGHPVSGRRPYSYVYDVLRTVGLPWKVPAWGEPVKLPPKASM